MLGYGMGEGRGGGMLVGGPAMACSVTLVTLVSHPYLRWRSATQGGVDPVRARADGSCRKIS